MELQGCVWRRKENWEVLDKFWLVLKMAFAGPPVCAHTQTGIILAAMAKASPNAA